MAKDSIGFREGEYVLSTMQRFATMTKTHNVLTRLSNQYVFWGTYRRYKQHSAVLLFANVDSRSLFTLVDIGAAGSIGDAGVYNGSQLKRNVEAGKWLNHAVWQCGSVSVRPFLIGNSAFSLSPNEDLRWG